MTSRWTFELAHYCLSATWLTFNVALMWLSCLTFWSVVTSLFAIPLEMLLDSNGKMHRAYKAPGLRYDHSPFIEVGQASVQDITCRPWSYRERPYLFPMFQHTKVPHVNRDLLRPVANRSPFPQVLTGLLFPSPGSAESIFPAHSHRGVDVSCSNSKISVRVDLYRLAFRCIPSFLRLGSCPVSRVTQQYIFFNYSLAECEGSLTTKGGQLVYSNSLHYSPGPQSHVIRAVPLTLPIQCHYNRYHYSYKVGYMPLVQPRTFLKSVRSKRIFSLTACNAQWEVVSHNQEVVLGDSMFFQANTNLLLPGERLYVDSCFITPGPDGNTLPRLEIITNNGCMVDSKRGGSSSQFWSGGGSVVRFSFDAFQFPGVQSKLLYLHCSLSVGASTPRPTAKSCNFNVVTDRWEELESDFPVCSCCNSSCDMAEMGPNSASPAAVHLVRSSGWSVTDRGIDGERAGEKIMMPAESVQDEKGRGERKDREIKFGALMTLSEEEPQDEHQPDKELKVSGENQRGKGEITTHTPEGGSTFPQTLMVGEDGERAVTGQVEKARILWNVDAQVLGSTSVVFRLQPDDPFEQGNKYEEKGAVTQTDVFFEQHKEDEGSGAEVQTNSLFWQGKKGLKEDEGHVFKNVSLSQQGEVVQKRGTDIQTQGLFEPTKEFVDVNSSQTKIDGLFEQAKEEEEDMGAEVEIGGFSGKEEDRGVDVQTNGLFGPLLSSSLPPGQTGGRFEQQEEEDEKGAVVETGGLSQEAERGVGFQTSGLFGQGDNVIEESVAEVLNGSIYEQRKEEEKKGVEAQTTATQVPFVSHHSNYANNSSSNQTLDAVTPNTNFATVPSNISELSDPSTAEPLADSKSWQGRPSERLLESQTAMTGMSEESNGSPQVLEGSSESENSPKEHVTFKETSEVSAKKLLTGHGRREEKHKERMEPGFEVSLDWRKLLGAQAFGKRPSKEQRRLGGERILGATEMGLLKRLGLW